MRLHNPSLLKHLRDILILPFSVTVIIPLLIYENTNWFFFDNLALTIFGSVILSCGLALFLYTVVLFRTYGRGTLAPWTPTEKLVIRGPYRYCRNPMISGVFFILIGESMVYYSINILIWAGIFLLINTTYFVLKEEPDLYKRFGDEYSEYKRNVPRWIPRLTPYDK
ncbi:MAG TPA: isoprenylcysteine carboxylmethyltransferase family protein [Cyclobacteriaceae bacterium]|nr:isoprenylcysteine carboxylmethyltransferase family protein [Cyclobacteriaceae bacterium]HMV09056.1 isoprenylcysteine carboxylmethyltransferase family protein [Cyclobacteriaceae bacterium]HMV89900.1 isoprenylcysteine carboxylmethyltransferase family protein [Cyclobacteriaceae bacterium]HMW99539.1 isoprenylcysteine carboxylmethyltransferase family protein [Cyclobacteriaceae bacterium]HMX51678.1 isoprenylcysteine carboxylmethyltransferase family protein [Cyclobacteriaceae bacterium]